ncbi:conserved Plasmodium protein, unknown function [Plasmodium malariae]|uniref:ATPase AAA-type core domain-containing protein n=1 Tax=Plasmodium malariae TaxID=5858 RepID=A0A1A8WB82_PLAMA|nr:conserved Plasmodium protein, unknown function [Plasmodium malariae]
MGRDSKKNSNTTNTIKLIELLKNEKNIFACVQCCEKSSYEIYNNLVQFIKKTLDIPICIIDIITIYNCKNIAKFLKDIFLDFINFVKRKKIYKFIFFLPYFDDWILPLQQERSLTFSDEKYGKYGESYLANYSDNDEKKNKKTKKKKRNRYEASMHIYNSIYYLKTNLLKKLNTKFCVKLIGFHITRDIFDLYRNLFDYKIEISQFVIAHIPYYIHINKNLLFFFKKGQLSLDRVYNIISNKTDFINTNDEYNINLFKSFFKYYIKFQNSNSGFTITGKRRDTKEVEVLNITCKKAVQNFIFQNKNYKLLNLLTNLENFKYLRTYNYFLSNKKKRKIHIFLFTGNDKNVLKYMCNYFYSSFFIKEYINTLLKKHTKHTIKRNTYQNSNSKNNTTNKVIIKGDITPSNCIFLNSSENCTFYYGNHGSMEYNNICNKRDATKCMMHDNNLKFGNYEITQKCLKLEDLAYIRKHFILKNRYQHDYYNIIHSEKKIFIKFYFSKINIPNTLLIYGNHGVGKTTLMKFIVHIISSNYKDMFIHRGAMHNTHNSITGDNTNSNTGNGSTTENKIYANNTRNNIHCGYSNIKYCDIMKKMYHKEKKFFFCKFRNVCIIPFENHLLINKTMGKNSIYIKKVFSMALKNQPAVIIFDNIDLFLEKNKNYNYPEYDQNEDVYKNIYILLIHYLNFYVNGSNKIKFIATCTTHPHFYKFSFLNVMEKILFLS